MTIQRGLGSAIVGFSVDKQGYPQAGDLFPGAGGCKTALSLRAGGFGKMGSTGEMKRFRLLPGRIKGVVLERKGESRYASFLNW
jgi:hypothetical protein